MSSHLRNLRLLSLLGVLTLALAGCSADKGGSPDGSASDGSKSASQEAKNSPLSIPSGTVIPVVLDQSLSSNGSHNGESFEATVSQDITVDGQVAIPKDAHARGQVTLATPSGHLETPAELQVVLTAVQIDGSWQDLQARAITMKGKSHRNRDLALIGGGTGVGALIGGLAGHGKGAAIGAAAGAGAGTAGAYATGKKDIVLSAESHLSFRLTAPLTMNK